MRQKKGQDHKRRNIIWTSVGILFMLVFALATTTITDNNIVTTGNISAAFFTGDGSNLSSLPTENVSWNQSFADTLYANIQFDYNQSLASFTQFGQFWYNQTSAGDQFSYNQSLASQLYSDANVSNIGVLQTTLNGTAIYSTFNSTYDTATGNSSWNQSLANTLYATITFDYNATIPAQLYSDANVSDIGVLQTTLNGTGIYSTFNSTYATAVGNLSWNQSLANTLYPAIGYNQTLPAQVYADLNFSIGIFQGFLNATAIYSTFNTTYASNVGNLSWNETRADLLYATIQFDYNQSLITQEYADANISNIGVLQTTLNLTGIYSTFNTTYASNVGNLSWNETRANLLYPVIGYNQTLPAQLYSDANISNIGVLQTTLNSTGIYSTFNSTYDTGVTNTFELNLSAGVSGDWTPTATATFSIGNATRSWASAFFSALISGRGVNATSNGNITLQQSSNVCLDGDACTRGITYNGSHIVIG